MLDSNFGEYADYMRKFQIQELFEDLCSAVMYKRPENVREFLVEQLEIRKEKGSVILPNFTESEVEDIFALYNLKNSEKISAFKAAEALRHIGHSNFDWETELKERPLPEEVDLPTFKQLAKNILGVSFS